MAEEKDPNEKIQDYLSGELSAEERQVFEQDLAKDEALAEETQLYESVNQELADQEVFDFRQKLEQLNDSQSAKVRSLPVASKRARNWRYILAVAAGFLILAIALGRLFQSDTPQQIVAQHLETFEPASVLGPAELARSANPNEVNPDSSENLWNKARSAFQNKDYITALDLISKVSPAERAGKEEQYQYERGLLQLLNGKPKAAIASFEAVSISNFPNKDWYLALAQIEINQKEEAINSLQELKQHTSTNKLRKQADELLKVLEMD